MSPYGRPSGAHDETGNAAGAGFVSASDSAAAQHAIAAHCSGPSGSPWTIAPEIIATTGTMIDDSPATLAGSRPTIANHQTLPMLIGTSAM